jgi:hypothetical protein
MNFGDVSTLRGGHPQTVLLFFAFSGWPPRRASPTMSQFRGRNLSDAEFAAIVREPPEFTLDQLCDHLRVPRHYLRRLARKDQRRAGTVVAGSDGDLGMLRLMRQLAVATAKLIYPAKPEDLLARAGLDLGAGHQGERRRKRAFASCRTTARRRLRRREGWLRR